MVRTSLEVDFDPNPLMRVESKSPHDFTLALDVDDYFEHEYDPMEIYRSGFARPIPTEDRNLLAVLRWNERVESPAFEVDFPRHDPSPSELEEAQQAVRRIVGADIDLAAFHEVVREDPVVGPLVEKYWGFKRLSGANFFEDAIRSIVGTRISHHPTKKRMVRDVREAWGEAFHYEGTTYYSYPRPARLAEAEPEEFREFGISRRKGEYIAGLAADIASGDLDLRRMEEADPTEFYERALEIRGIGPWTAQSLMLRRNRPDARFPSHRTDGKEKGIRRWILLSYEMDPHESSEEEWQQLRDQWAGYEALVSQYLYLDWIMRKKADEHSEEG